jgi:glycerate-2-kinase
MLFQAAVARAQPLENMKAFVPEPPSRGRTFVLSAGKAEAAGAIPGHRSRR